MKPSDNKDLRKLAPAQIESLFTFCRKHYVTWYEIQVELVDHLANAIEAQWKKNPKISFDEALKREYKEFGILGFTKILRARAKQAERKTKKDYWRLALQQFRWPQILSVLTITALSYTTIKLNLYAGLSFLGCLLIYGNYKLLKNGRAYNKLLKSSKKNFLIATCGLPSSLSSAWILYFIVSGIPDGFGGLFKFPLVFCLLCAGFYVGMKTKIKLNDIIMNNLIEEYPEAFEFAD